MTWRSWAIHGARACRTPIYRTPLNWNVAHLNIRVPHHSAEPFQAWPSISFSTTAPAFSGNDPQLHTSVESKPIGKLDARIFMSFRCKPCQGQVSKTLSRHSYEKGVVLIECPHCAVRHLIADNLNWFGDSKQNIETIVAAEGQKVKRTLDPAHAEAWPDGVKEILMDHSCTTIEKSA